MAVGAPEHRRRVSMPLTRDCRWRWASRAQASTGCSATSREQVSASAPPVAPDRSRRAGSPPCALARASPECGAWPRLQRRRWPSWRRRRMRRSPGLDRAWVVSTIATHRWRASRILIRRRRLIGAYTVSRARPVLNEPARQRRFTAVGKVNGSACESIRRQTVGQARIDRASASYRDPATIRKKGTAK